MSRVLKVLSETVKFSQCQKGWDETSEEVTTWENLETLVGAHCPCELQGCWWVEHWL